MNLDSEAATPALQCTRDLEPFGYEAYQKTRDVVLVHDERDDLLPT